MINVKKYMFPVLLSLLFLSISSINAYEALNGPTQLIQYKASKAYEGYTLIPSMNSNKRYLIDMLGYAVHAWEHKTKPPGLHFVLPENGHVLGNIGTGMMQERPGEQNSTKSNNQQATAGNNTKLSIGRPAAGLIELDWDGNFVGNSNTAQPKALCIMILSCCHTGTP